MSDARIASDESSQSETSVTFVFQCVKPENLDISGKELAREDYFKVQAPAVDLVRPSKPKPPLRALSEDYCKPHPANPLAIVVNKIYFLGLEALPQ